MYGDMSVGGSFGAAAFDRQTFGAQVVTKTMDYMNGSSSSDLAPVDKETFGASVVSKTLDYMNSGSIGRDNSSLYDFQTSVLGAAAGLGGFVNKMV